MANAPLKEKVIPTKRIYASSSGDVWDLVRNGETGHVTVRHQPNLASGGRASEIDLDAFVSTHQGKVETVALLHMIGTLVKDEAAGSVRGERDIDPTDAQVITRAKQLFEEESAESWGAPLPSSPCDDDRSAYIDRARRELEEIEEEGHS